MHVEQTISWTAVVAIIIFSFTQMTAFASKALENYLKTKHLKVAIRAELSQILTQSGEASSTDRFDQFVNAYSIDKINAYAIPLYKSRLFEANVERLPLLRSDLVVMIVEAYGLIARMNGLIEHFKSKEFLAADEHVHDAMENILKDTNRDLHTCLIRLLPMLGF